MSKIAKRRITRTTKPPTTACPICGDKRGLCVGGVVFPPEQLWGRTKANRKRT